MIEREKMLVASCPTHSIPSSSLSGGRARDLSQALNATRESQQLERRFILSDLFLTRGDSVLQPPFFCDNGTNIEWGERVFFNCIVLDVCGVRIGHYMIGPAVQI